MEPPVVVAAIITGGITVIGFFISNWFIARRIDMGRAKDATKLAELQAALSAKNQEELESIKLENQKTFETLKAGLVLAQKSREGRREALELLLNASSIAKSAAKVLRHDLTNQSGADRVQQVAESLQKMSPFFEKASQADMNLHLIQQDVSEVKQVQDGLVTMLLLLDFDAESQDFAKLDTALSGFNQQVVTFQEYVRSATAS